MWAPFGNKRWVCCCRLVSWYGVSSRRLLQHIGRINLWVVEAPIVLRLIVELKWLIQWWFWLRRNLMVIFSLHLVVYLVPEHTGLCLLVLIEAYHIDILFNLSFFLLQLCLWLHRNVLKQSIHIAVRLLKGMLAHGNKLLLFFFTGFWGLRRLNICVLDLYVFKDASALLIKFNGVNLNSF